MEWSKYPSALSLLRNIYVLSMQFDSYLLGFFPVPCTVLVARGLEMNKTDSISVVATGMDTGRVTCAHDPPRRGSQPKFSKLQN